MNLAASPGAAATGANLYCSNTKIGDKKATSPQLRRAAGLNSQNRLS